MVINGHIGGLRVHMSVINKVCQLDGSGPCGKSLNNEVEGKTVE